ncbi:MAG: LuxR C-terminal-related transcriptional regulator [Chloroflexota bacterium]
MMDHLVHTKLFIPPVRPALVPRLRIIQKLNAGVAGKLTLICAPAGFGKTTLISDWLQQTDLPVAWLSLDPDDNDPTRFFQYVIAALQTIAPTLGQSVQEMLQSPQPPSHKSLLPTLINDIAARSTKLALVLDDYHVIETQSIHDALAFLLAHLPPQMHIFMTSRTDPPLPLPRLRARGQMTEVRAEELRFTSLETTTFLNEVTGLNLSQENVAALDERTEGWATGLQLAALSMQGVPDVSAFIAAFTGDDAYIVDYLLEEVLDQQPEKTRAFLLQTSILDRMTGALCDAVTGGDDGQAMLETLRQANLFVVSLDHKRQWYRYHHLFADLLRTRLRQEMADQVPLIYQQASEWCEATELIEEAVHYALMSADFVLAAALIARHIEAITWQGKYTMTLSWLDALPEEMVRAHPRLSLTRAWLLFGFFNDSAAVIEPWLQNIEVILSGKGASSTSNPALLAEDTSEKRFEIDPRFEIDGGEAQKIRTNVDILRANLARRRGDATQAIAFGQQALEHAPADLKTRVEILYLLAAIYDSIGNMGAASQTYAESIALNRTGGNDYITLLITAHLIEALWVQGQLHRAQGRFQGLSQVQALRQGPAAGMAYISIGEVRREWNDLDGAATDLQTGIDLCRPFETWAVVTLKGIISLAWIKQAQGDTEGVLALFQEMDALAVGKPMPYPTARIAAAQAHLWLVMGNVPAATYWAKSNGLHVDDELSYLVERDYLVFARLLMGQSKPEEALVLLERLLQEAEVGARGARVIEIKILQALAHQTQGERSQAVATLAEAITLAEPEGFVRVFIDEGVAMVTLLNHAASQGVAPIYIAKLLAASNSDGLKGALPLQRVGEKKPTVPLAPTIAANMPATPKFMEPFTKPLAEPLTKRELQTLRFLATELSPTEIAGEMVVSVSTVRSYTKYIYSKLNVHSRVEAVHRAKELGLL